MKSIYLVLDMQNDLVHPDGPNGKSPLGTQVRERQVVKRTAESIAKFRARGIPIGFVRVGFSPDYRECPANSPLFSAARSANLFQLGSWGTEIHPDLDVREQDIQVAKHRVSPFYSTTLMAQLRAMGIERIFCSGVSTHAVVQATVREGHDRDFVMVVLEDCCAAPSAEDHASSIAVLGRFGTVAGTNDIDGLLK